MSSLFGCVANSSGRQVVYIIGREMSPAGGGAGPVDGVGVLRVVHAALARLQGLRSGRGGLVAGTANLAAVAVSAAAFFRYRALGVRHEGTRLGGCPFLEREMCL